MLHINLHHNIENNQRRNKSKHNSQNQCHWIISYISTRIGSKTPYKKNQTVLNAKNTSLKIFCWL